MRYRITDGATTFALLSLGAALAAAVAPVESVSCIGCSPSPDGELGHLQLLQRAFVLDTRPTGKVKAAPPTSSTTNSVGDLAAFISLTAVCTVGILTLCAAFCALRVRHPVIYSNSVLEGWAPATPPETFLGWLRPTLSLTVDEVAESVTLDAAMLLEFSHLCMKILAIVGIPMVGLAGSMNWAFGGNRAGDDYLSYLCLGNIVNGSWFCWCCPLLMLLVVMVVTHSLHLAMRDFLPRRHKWLREMSEVRARTVLVENIPTEYQSERALKRYFQQLTLGATVQSLHLCKDITNLEALMQLHSEASHRLEVVENEWLAKLQDPDETPMVRDPSTGTLVEAVPFWRRQQDMFMSHIMDEREAIRKHSLSKREDLLTESTSTCFVTFSERSSAEIVSRLSGRIVSDPDVWRIHSAPEPSDVLWSNLIQEADVGEFLSVVGHMLIAVLFLLYVPLVISATNLAKVTNLGAWGLNFLQPFWRSFAPTVGLHVVVAFLPTFLNLIFRHFFAFHSMTGLQHTIQVRYFWFQVVFVLLAAPVGQNLRQLVRALIQEPLSAFGVLAETMLYATHFYMNFLVLQWLSHFVSLARLLPLIEYSGLCIFFRERKPKTVAEPEDQDCYGMGARSAQWTIMVSISIVFGTLAPPINLLCIVNFAVCRLVYAYLMCFAETKKPDLGGAFFVMQLRHVFVACIIFCILMMGVLFHRAPNSGPAVMAVPSLVWVIFSKARFEKYNWERLPMQELVGIQKKWKGRPEKGEYVQPQLPLPEPTDQRRSLVRRLNLKGVRPETMCSKGSSCDCWAAVGRQA